MKKIFSYLTLLSLFFIGSTSETLYPNPSTVLSDITNTAPFVPYTPEESNDEDTSIDSGTASDDEDTSIDSDIATPDLQSYYNATINNNDVSQARKCFKLVLHIRQNKKQNTLDVSGFDNALANLLKQFPSTIITSNEDFIELQNMCVIDRENEEFLDVILAHILIGYAPTEFITYSPSFIIEIPSLIEIIANRSINPNLQDNEKKTILHYFFESNNDIEEEHEKHIINALFPRKNQGANVPYIDFLITDDSGKSLLQWAEERPDILQRHPRLKAAYQKNSPEHLERRQKRRQERKQQEQERQGEACKAAYQQLRLMR